MCKVFVKGRGGSKVTQPTQKETQVTKQDVAECHEDIRDEVRGSPTLAARVNSPRRHSNTTLGPLVS